MPLEVVKVVLSRRKCYWRGMTPLKEAKTTTSIEETKAMSPLVEANVTAPLWMRSWRPAPLEKIVAPAPLLYVVAS
jgi:hypothetical protein